VKVTKAEDGAIGGKGLWRPAALGFRAGYENEKMKKYLSGGYIG
jgi:nitrate reductase alpha subunit